MFIVAICFVIIGIIVGVILSRNIVTCEKKVKAMENEPQRWGKYEVDEIREEATKCKKLRTIIPLIAFVLALMFFIISLVAIVPTGHTGIKTTFGKVEDDVLPSGFNIKLPWQNVVNMDNREQRSPFQLEAFSKDIQQVEIQGSINININKSTAMDLYKNVGVNYPEILVQPRVYEDVKIVIAKYTAENLIENRQNAADQIQELLRTELEEKGINVISFAIENVDFTDAFESAVEAKQVATQKKQQSQTEQEQKTMEQEKQAERDRIKAQAAADVKKINADAAAYSTAVQAEAQAKANKELAATLSESLIKYNTVQKWDGKVPIVSSGEGGSNIIDLRTLTDMTTTTEETKEEKKK